MHDDNQQNDIENDTLDINAQHNDSSEQYTETLSITKLRIMTVSSMTLVIAA